MTERKKRYTQKDGRRLYEEDDARLMANPKFRKIYAEEARKKEIWLQLAEARQEAGLTQVELAKRLGVTQKQVSTIETKGRNYTLATLGRYVEALGGDFTLEVAVRRMKAR